MIELLMLVRDEQETLPRTLPPLLELVDEWTIVDTGSTDDTTAIVGELAAGRGGWLHRSPWRGFAENRNELFDLATGQHEWLLLWDADWQATVHPELRDWLAADPFPDVTGWMVEIRDRGLAWWLPQLLRHGPDWRFQGDAHACLGTPMTRRKLRGLTADHLRAGAGGNSQARLEQNLEALRPRYDAGDPRATFYTAETLRHLGRVEEAVDAYRARAVMDAWEEEGWYAAYQAARLDEDLDGLLEAHRRRPWRHEPLTAAGRLLARRPNGDVLFQERL